MKKLEWINDTEFSIDGVRFACVQGDYSAKSTADRLILLKDRGTLDQYARELGGKELRSAFEFGIFQGGSPALFTLWLELDKFVGVDVSASVPALDALVVKRDLERRLRTHHGVSQSDQSRIEQIIRDEFGATSLDLIIDDASHRYSTTRRAFEIAFPLLRPGGSYILEDWGWAHWRGINPFPGQTALSMLVMELIMLCASRNDIISEVRVLPSFVVVEKSPHAPPLPQMSMDQLVHKRGIALSGTKNLNLAEVCKLVIERLARGLPLGW